MILLYLIQFGVLFVSLGAVALVILTVLIYQRQKNRSRILRELKRSDTKPISSIVANEYVKIAGRVSSFKSLLKAPFSQRDCIAYHVLVRENKNGIDEYWTVVDELEIVSFFIEVEGQNILVKVNRCAQFQNVHLVTDWTEDSSVFGKAANHLESYLNNIGRSSKNGFGINKSMSYTEGVLASGQTVVVKGVVEPDSGGEQILTLSGSASQPLLLTNDPRVLG